MSHAAQIVNALLEVSKGVEQFMKSLPPSVMASFHIAPDGEKGVYAAKGHRGDSLVYLNNRDGTRDFIGYIREITGAPEGPYWVTKAAWSPPAPGSQGARTFDAYTGQRHPDQFEAAKALYDIYRAKSRFLDAKKAKLYWRGARH